MCGHGAMPSDGQTVRNLLEVVLNQDIIVLETECIRLGTVKLPRSIPTLASNSNCVCSKEQGVAESQWLTVFGLL